MIRRLLLIAALICGTAAANAAAPVRIQVFGKSSVANDVGYGTVVDSENNVSRCKATPIRIRELSTW